jgi:S1-C subfamily serine protease
VGERILGRFDETIDLLGQTLWLTPRPSSSSACRPTATPTRPSPGPAGRTIGLTAWLYQGRGVARSLIVGAPADVAGIRPGDEIVSIDDRNIIDHYSHLDAICSAPEVVTVVFRNSHGEHTVVLTPTLISGS